jgi:hypothetical protein
MKDYLKINTRLTNDIASMKVRTPFSGFFFFLFLFFSSLKVEQLTMKATRPCVRKEESGERHGGANNCKDGARKESMHRHTHSAFRRCNPSNRGMLLAVLAASGFVCDVTRKERKSHSGCVC